MKLARLLWRGEVFLAIADSAQKMFRVLKKPADMTALIEDFEALAESDYEIGFNEARLLAPFGRTTRNIFCVGKNYREHAKEFAQSGFDAGSAKGADIDPYPAIFTKPWTSIVGPDEVVDLHQEATGAVDYEAELAVVIGRGGRKISAEDAFSHVFGYTIVNDVTARDRQQRHKQWFAGKALDGFCPMGPWIVTQDEIDGEALDIRCWVNNELRQSANTRDLIFSIPSLIETLSAGMALMPGDVISTGTPAGVGIGFNPPRFLRSGDRVRVSIEGIGSLTNEFR